MPITSAGRKVMRSLQHQYGDKAKQIYYALQVEGKGGKGKHRWEGAKPGGTLAKARHTYSMEHKKKRLTTKARNSLGSKEFALPGRKYPLNNPSHARNALARVSQFGTPSEKARVRSAVHSKYPNIGKKKRKTFEQVRKEHFGLK